MRARPLYLIVALLLLVGCSPTAVVVPPQTATPVFVPNTSACEGTTHPREVGGAYQPLTNEAHLVQKVVVVDDQVPLYIQPKTNSTQENSVPVWTYFDVFERANGFCRVGPPGGQPFGWIADEHLRPWTHLVAARLKDGIEPGQVPFFKSWPSTNADHILAWNEVAGDNTTIPFPLIDTYPNSGKPEAYQVLHLMRSPQDSTKLISTEGWVTPDHFDLEVYATQQSLRVVIETTNAAATKLRSGGTDISEVFRALLAGQGATYEGPQIGVYEYSSICGKLPLGTDNPLEIKQDFPTKTEMAKEFERSAELLDDFLRREENWRNPNGGAWLPVSYLPSFGSDNKYASCE